ncbi:MAG: hypothetical protein K2Q18_06125 [Bdellovibrionales bacterium]|nr:hypothetical protein [Bdellovibrionales bacterium]
MIKFLDSLDLTMEAKEGIITLIFGELEPSEAISFDQFLEKESDEKLMLIVLRNIKMSNPQKPFI